MITLRPSFVRIGYYFLTVTLNYVWHYSCFYTNALPKVANCCTGSDESNLGCPGSGGVLSQLQKILTHTGDVNYQHDLLTRLKHAQS